ncbi:MAG TPA: cytochrome c biogenesis protein ResB [Pyrinomonadaceae bacterium]|jgi:cytochrome c biogenesis protein
MSVIEKTGNEIIVSSPDEKAGESPFSNILKLLSSVRFGIILLITVGLLCFFGMVIMQQNLEGFERYYADLTPAQKLVYGSLNLFDIYHSWYFNALLLVLSFNIVLASIDRFPKTWTFISKPKLDASAKWLNHQDQNASFETIGESAQTVAETIAEKAKRAGWRKTLITEKGGKTFVFAQSGAWNRLGAYAVHVGLLTIFIGGFMTGEFGNTGQMALQPGQTSNQIYDVVSDLDQLNQVTKQLPFEIYCTDIQQKLIKRDESISAMNTIDWLTRIQIKDETGVTSAVVQLNRPFDYRGYRFFQSSFVATGRARSVTVRLKAADNSTPEQDIAIERNGTAALPDGTAIRFVDFRGNFSIGKEDPNEDTSTYPNPAAVLQVTPRGGQPATAYAFGEKLANIPIAQKPVGGYTYRLVDFEKVGDQHILSVQRDPGASVVYVGFVLLILTLVAVFFFSHQRVWAMVERVREDKFKVTFGGNTNRNQVAFGEKFKRFIRGFGEQETKI